MHGISDGDNHSVSVLDGVLDASIILATDPCEIPSARELVSFLMCSPRANAGVSGRKNIQTRWGVPPCFSSESHIDVIEHDKDQLKKVRPRHYNMKKGSWKRDGRVKGHQRKNKDHQEDDWAPHNENGECRRKSRQQQRSKPSNQLSAIDPFSPKDNKVNHAEKHGLSISTEDLIAQEHQKPKPRRGTYKARKGQKSAVSNLSIMMEDQYAGTLPPIDRSDEVGKNRTRQKHSKSRRQFRAPLPFDMIEVKEDASSMERSWQSGLSGLRGSRSFDKMEPREDELYHSEMYSKTTRHCQHDQHERRDGDPSQWQGFPPLHNSQTNPHEIQPL